MNYWNAIFGIAGLLQIGVACYALRLNRLFGTHRVGWSLFTAFFLLAVFHLAQSAGPLDTMSEFGLKVDVVYGLISLLLLTGMIHIEAVLKLRLNAEVGLELRVQEKTAELHKVNAELSLEVEERKRLAAQMEVTYRELLAASHTAGMTEVATSVIHNVGNVLNSVNISASVVADHLQQSKISSLTRAAALLQEHAGHLAHFLTDDPRGRQLPEYLEKLAIHMEEEQKTLLKEIGFVKSKIEHIKDIVAMQQNYANVAGVTETVMVTDMIEDALQMNVDALARHDVELVREYDPRVREIVTQKHKVLQILVNLIRNAKYACDESGHKNKRMTLRVADSEQSIRISVIDNGIGVPAENLTRIFNHGFTTRKNGHGFGLHGGALTAKELGGALTVQSEGAGKGAMFTLELPKQSKASRTINTDIISRSLTVV